MFTNQVVPMKLLLKGLLSCWQWEQSNLSPVSNFSSTFLCWRLALVRLQARKRSLKQPILCSWTQHLFSKEGVRANIFLKFKEQIHFLCFLVFSGINHTNDRMIGTTLQFTLSIYVDILIKNVLFVLFLLRYALHRMLHKESKV